MLFKRGICSGMTRTLQRQLFLFPLTPPLHKNSVCQPQKSSTQTKVSVHHEMVLVSLTTAELQLMMQSMQLSWLLSLVVQMFVRMQQGQTVLNCRVQSM